MHAAAIGSFSFRQARQRALLDMKPYEGDLASRLPSDCPYSLGKMLAEGAVAPDRE